MAAPKKADHERRKFQIPPARCTQAEYETIEYKAKLAGLTMSEFVRKSALGQNIKAPAVSSIDTETIHHLRRIGQNLNQLVTRLHGTGKIMSSWEATHKELSDFLHSKIFQ